MAKYANSLTDVLGALDKGDMNYLDGLSDRQKDDILKKMWIYMRYQSCVKGDLVAEITHLTMTQSAVNVDYMSLYGHPDLLWKLTASCGTGKKKYHDLLPQPKAIKVSKKEKMVLSAMPELKLDEIPLFLEIADIDELCELCEVNGYAKSEIEKAFRGK